MVQIVPSPITFLLRAPFRTVKSAFPFLKAILSLQLTSLNSKVCSQGIKNCLHLKKFSTVYGKHLPLPRLLSRFTNAEMGPLSLKCLFTSTLPISSPFASGNSASLHTASIFRKTELPAREARTVRCSDTAETASIQGILSQNWHRALLQPLNPPG